MVIRDIEKRAGVDRVEVRHGLAQANVSGIAAPVMDGRLRVLDLVAKAGISIDFLKLTEDGLSFTVPEGMAEAVEKVLQEAGTNAHVWSGLSVVLVHAVNMRDEEGLIADIVQQSIAGGGRLSHIGDMHDRLLLIVETGAAETIADQLRSHLVGAPR